MTSDFSARLKNAIDNADLTTSDLQRWFDRPYATVWTWVHRGYEPRGPAGRKAKKLLVLLEWAITNRRGFPIPPETPEKIRPAYITQTRHELERNPPVPASGATQ